MSAAAPPGERRNLVLLFCDVCDSTAIASGMEPELFAALLQEMRDAASVIVPRHGGEIVRVDGDGCLCIFGFPEAHEDDGRRAVEAALELHAAVASFELHSGIHGGTVLLREGDLVRGRYEMLGDATNVAARLCDSAGPGGILVSEGTLGSDRHFFRTGERQRVAVRGRAGGLPAYAVLGRADVSSRFAARSHAGQTPFTGRGGELAQLRGWLDGTNGDLPLLLHGPPGNGKTRLLGEFLAQAEAAGWAVHAASCEAYLAARPLQPIHQLADSLEVGNQPAPPPGKPVDVEHLAALIAEAAAQRPVLIAIDDWQWADDASVQLLDGVLTGWRQPTHPVRLLLASRLADARLLARRRVATVDVPVLPPHDAARAINALVRVSDPATASRIVRAAGGSPLLIEELCHAWRRGEVGLDGDLERTAWIDLLVQSRFAALPPHEAGVLRAAAVIGVVIPAGLLAATTGEAPDSPAVAALAEADFLYADPREGVLRFKHGLTRDAVHAAIGLAERERLHALVAAALLDLAAREGDEPHVAALAHHLAASGDAARAFPYAVRAGDTALRLGALDRAQAHYRAALDGLHKLGDNAQTRQHYRRLLNKYGLACIVDPSPEQLPVLGGLARRMEALGDPGGQTRSQYWLGAISYGMGRGRDSVRQLRQASALAEASGDDGLLPMIAAKLAQSLFAAGDYDAGAQMFAALIPALRAQDEATDADALAYLLCCHGFLLADQGAFAASDAAFAEAEALIAGRNPPMVASLVSFRSAVELWRGDWAAAEALAHRCIDSCRESGVRYQAMMSHALAAYARWCSARDETAIETLLSTAQWFAGARSRQYTSLLYGWLAEIMAERGERQQVRHFAARALVRIREGGDRLGEGMAFRALARAEQAAGNRAAADRALERARRSAVLRCSPREEALAWLCEADLRRQRGDPARAAALEDQAAAALAAMTVRAPAQGTSLALSASR